MTYQIKVAPEARHQFWEACDWWRENRPTVPSRVMDEYHRAVTTLSSSPNIGHLHEERDEQVVRRLRLRKTPYFLYYIVDETNREVLIVSLWSAMRGEGPPL